MRLFNLTPVSLGYIMLTYNDFNFNSNDLKTHAFNLMKISKWYFSPIQEGTNIENFKISINTCLNILTVAHGFKKYKSLLTAIDSGSKFESLQSNETYFNRLMNSDLRTLLNFTDIQLQLAYSEIDHFFDMCASYICETQMDLNTLSSPSHLAGINLHADVSILKYFNITNRSFLKTALLNHIVVSSPELSFPNEVLINLRLMELLKDSQFILKSKNDATNINFYLDQIDSVWAVEGEDIRVLFDIRLVNQLNSFLYKDGYVISENLSPYNFKIDFPNKLPNAEKFKIDDLIAFIYKSETDDYESFNNETFDDHIRTISLSNLVFCNLEIMFTNPSIHALKEKLQPYNVYDKSQKYSEICNLIMEFECYKTINNNRVLVDVRVSINVHVCYSTTVTHDQVKFSIDSISPMNSSTEFNIFLHTDDMNPDSKLIHFKKEFIANNNFPLKDYFIKYLNQKLNQSKYEIFALHNTIDRLVEEEL